MTATIEFFHGSTAVADHKVLDDVAQWGAGGVGLGGGIWMFRWLVMWLTGRVDAQTKAVDAERLELDQGWKAYRLALEKRLELNDQRMERQDKKIEQLEREVEECHDSKRVIAAELAELRGYNDGEGQARQLGATIAAADRLQDRDRNG